MRGCELVDLLKVSVEAKALRANAKLGREIPGRTFLHLDYTDSAHPIRSVKPALIWQITLVIKNSQILKMSGDAQERSNSPLNRRERLRPHLDLNDMDLATPGPVDSHDIHYVPRPWPARIDEYFRHDEFVKKELSNRGLCTRILLLVAKHPLVHAKPPGTDGKPKH
jgi:hypothetical protein